MSDATVETLVKEAQAKTKINFVDIIRDKIPVSDTVEFFWDDATAYPIRDLAERDTAARAVIADETASTKEKADAKAQRASILADKERIAAELEASKVTLHVRGVSDAAKEILLNEVNSQYPVEYEVESNFVTGEKVKTAIPNADASNLHLNKLWLAHFVKLETADGYDDEFTIEKVAAIRKGLGPGAVQAIQLAMVKVDQAVDWFKVVTDEGFLAKS